MCASLPQASLLAAAAIVSFCVALGASSIEGGPGGRALASGPDGAGRALQAFEGGAAAMAQGRLVDACVAYDKAVRLTPTWALARLELGRCARLMGDPAGVADLHLRRAATAMADRAVVHLERGLAAEDLGRTRHAREHFRRAASVAPTDPRVTPALARVVSDRRVGVVELEHLRRLVASQPEELAAWRQLADVSERVGALDEAERALRHVLESARDKAGAAVALARFGARTDRPAAVEEGRRALR